jgi:hypothetical protein
MQLPQLIISMFLFIVLFFGMGFLLNMLLRSTWIMAVVYPVVVIMIIDKIRFYEYFVNPGESFSALGGRFLALAAADLLILSCGLFGAVVAGIAIRALRVRGYQMF